MTNKQAKITAEIQLLRTDQNGLGAPLTQKKVGCIFTYRGEDFSCFILIDDGKGLSPGMAGEIFIKFVYPELIVPRLKVGARFDLRDYRVFAHGKILAIN